MARRGRGLVGVWSMNNQRSLESLGARERCRRARCVARVECAGFLPFFPKRLFALVPLCTLHTCSATFCKPRVHPASALDFGVFVLKLLLLAAAGKKLPRETPSTQCAHLQRLPEQAMPDRR